MITYIANMKPQLTVCGRCNSLVTTSHITSFGTFVLCAHTFITNGNIEKCLCIDREDGYKMPHCCSKCSSKLFYIDSKDRPRQLCFQCKKIYPAKYRPRDVIAKKQAVQHILPSCTDSNRGFLDYDMKIPMCNKKRVGPKNEKKIEKERRSRKKSQKNKNRKTTHHSNFYNGERNYPEDWEYYYSLLTDKEVCAMRKRDDEYLLYPEDIHKVWSREFDQMLWYYKEGNN